ncbi:hypothetical protein WJX79_001758 [Trebouxia sp. C0005]
MDGTAGSHNVQLRLSFEAVLQCTQVVSAAAVTSEQTGQTVLADTAEGGNSTSAATTVEQRLQVSYMLPTGEAVSSPQLFSTPSSTTDEAAVVESAATPDKQSLKWSSSHVLSVTDTIVCNLASSNAAFAMTFIAASRTVTKTAEAATLLPPTAAKPAKGIKGAVTDEVPWQADQQHIVAVDLAPLLVGDTALVCVLPQKGLAMPVQLQAYSTVQIHVEVFAAPASLPVLLPLQTSPVRTTAQVTEWQSSKAAGGMAMSTRKLLFQGSAVLLAGSLNVDDFLQACREQPVVFEVHDRDALPQPQFVAPVLEVKAEQQAAAPKSTKGGKTPAKVPVAKPKTPSAAAIKGQPRVQAEGTSLPIAEPAAEYVCGIAKCSLAGLGSGEKRLELRANVMPFTTVRGAAGLEWNTRPGRYIEAGTSFKVTVRSNLPLTQMLPSQQAALPSPFSRAVFLFDYADSELLHSLESTIRAVNAQCLGLHKSPGALAAQAKAASVAGSLPADTGLQGGVKQAAVTSSAASHTLSGSASGSLEEEVPMPVLQALSTYKLTAEQAAEHTLDLLTGFQLVDGKERMIVVEGLAEGAMQRVEGIALQALTGALPQPNATCRRAVHWHQGLRYKSRLYSELGPNLWIIKMRAPLSSIEGQAASYATGKVRKECVEGLRRVVGLRRVEWARQVDSLNLLPTCHMLNLLDKKFGGELTKEDVQGVALDPKQSLAAGSNGRSLRQGSSFRSSFRSRPTTAQSGDGSESLQGVEDLDVCRVDCWNGGYLETKGDSAASRQQQDWMTHNKQLLHNLQAAKQGIRDSWATWNPQHRAAHELQQLLQSGQITLQDTILAQRQAGAYAQPEPHAGSIPPADAEARGWYAHPKPFAWPAAKDSQAFKAHPDKPSEARCEDLAQAWHDPYTPQAPERIDGQEDFHTVMPAPALLCKEASYWQSVHQAGQGIMLERQEAARKEKEAWQAKVVVANVNMHTATPHRAKPSQVDRMQPLLQTKPQKLAFKMTASPPLPCSMFTAEPYTDGRKQQQV